MRLLLIIFIVLISFTANADDKTDFTCNVSGKQVLLFGQGVSTEKINEKISITLSRFGDFVTSVEIIGSEALTTIILGVESERPQTKLEIKVNNFSDKKRIHISTDEKIDNSAQSQEIKFNTITGVVSYYRLRILENKNKSQTTFSGKCRMQ
jgi:hypothetical protein